MKRRVLAMLLVTTLSFGLCACSGGKEESQKPLEVTAGTPTYEDDKQIELAAYSGPRRAGYRYWNGYYGQNEEDPNGGWEGWITKEGFQDYLDCGFTYLMAETDGLYDYSYKKEQSVSEFEESDLYEYMELAEEMQIPVVVLSNTLTQMTSSTDPRLSEEQKAFLEEMVTDLSQYEMFKGFNFRDEPSIEHAKTFGAVKEYLDSLKPDLFYFTSFLPIYCSDITRLSQKNTADKEAAYAEYVDAFSDAVGTFAYDSYPLVSDPVMGTTYVDETWFQNLRMVAESAKEKGYDAGITIQSSSFGPYGQEASAMHKRTITSKADITFQLYSALAYGFKYVNYFTYWQHSAPSETEDFYSAMINYPEEDGQEPIKTEAYYAVKEANEEVKKFDHVFLSFDWEGTFALTSDGETLDKRMKWAGEYESPRIAGASAKEDAIVGCMKDEDGYDGYMIVNATDPGQNISNSVTIQFREASKALVYVNGEESTVTLDGGSYTFELASGEGVFVIPIQ